MDMSHDVKIKIFTIFTITIFITSESLLSVDINYSLFVCSFKYIFSEVFDNADFFL